MILNYKYLVELRDKLEGWDYKDYLNELIELIKGIIERKDA